MLHVEWAIAREGCAVCSMSEGDGPQSNYICAPADFGAHLRTALVTGHPGHELVVFGWVAETKPLVHVFTDGSGSRGASRAEASKRLLHALGAAPGEVFSQLSDREFYSAIAEIRVSFFLRLLDKLVVSFLAHDIEFVLSDAVEGWNPTHDLCGAIAGAAAAIVQQTTGKCVPHYEFSLIEWLRPERHGRDERCAHLQLDEALLETKLRSAREYGGLNEEIRSALAQHDRDYFGLECLRKAEPFSASRFESSKPYYEVYGERRRAEGVFPSVIRYRDHVRPIIEVVLRQCDSGEY